MGGAVLRVGKSEVRVAGKMKERGFWGRGWVLEREVGRWGAAWSWPRIEGSDRRLNYWFGRGGMRGICLFGSEDDRPWTGTWLKWTPKSLDWRFFFLNGKLVLLERFVNKLKLLFKFWFRFIYFQFNIFYSPKEDQISFCCLQNVRCNVKTKKLNIVQYVSWDEIKNEVECLFTVFI